jgi:hypothetical protein
MTKSKPDDTAPKKIPDRSETREQRLKAALKANLARRKAQTRARADNKPETGEIKR